MSVSSLLKVMRPHGKWTREARMIYATRRLLAFFEKYPDLKLIACGYNPGNRVLWDGIFRFFFRHYPTRTETYVEYGKEMSRQWWYNEEVYDPDWDKLLREYKASLVYHTIILPYLQKDES